MGIEGHADDLNSDMHCEVRVVAESRSEQCKVAGRNGNVVVRVPVVISRSKIHININAGLKFERYIIDILNCRRDMQLTECRLLDMGNRRYGKLYIDGFINERIEYIDAGCSDERELCGVIRFLSVKIPFECVTQIDYFQQPMIADNIGFNHVKIKGSNYHEPDPDSRKQLLQGGFTSADGMYCETEKYEISASMTKLSLPLDSRIFNEVQECIAISATIILLQEQMVNIY